MGYKLLLFNSTRNFGSTGRIAESIGIMANNSGFDAYIVHGPRCINPSALKYICVETYFGEKLHGIETRLFDAHGLGSVYATHKLIRKIRRIKPDIIHIHNIHGYYINYIILFSFLKEYNAPVVWTLHDCWSFTGHCSHFDLIGCDKWKTECGKCPQKNEYPKSYTDFSRRNYKLKKKAFTGCSNLTIVPVSHWLENLVKESFLKDYRTKVIYNGIDTDVFSIRNNADGVRAKYGIKSKYIVLGVASPFTQRKGFDDFIELSKMLPEEYGIVMVGLNSEQKKQLPENIVGIKRTQDVSELASLYSCADVFVNLTYEDNFPTTNLEAMACGTPVVTYRTGGSPEALDVETGIVVEKGNLAGVCDAVAAVCRNGKASYVEACRNRVVRLFNKNDRFREYIDLYDTLLGI